MLVADAPDQVRNAFHDVVRAWEDRERMTQEAEGYREDVIPRARGEAQEIIRSAEAYAERRVLMAQGEAARFTSVLPSTSWLPKSPATACSSRPWRRSCLTPKSSSFSTQAGEVLPLLPLGRSLWKRCQDQETAGGDRR